jgi:hypothetical protein
LQTGKIRGICSLPVHTTESRRIPKDAAAGRPVSALSRSRFDDGVAGVREKKLPREEDPGEMPQDDPRQKTDWPDTKQTDEPWKGNPAKEQRNEVEI